MPTDLLDVGHAVRWRAAVEDVVRDTAATLGVDPDEVCDSVEFVESLEPTIDLPIDSDAFTAAVETLVAQWSEATGKPYGDVAESDGRVSESDGEDTLWDRIDGRLLEALDDDENGGRVFRVRILTYGDSRNGRRYGEAVMRSATALYNGAKAYDHHRTAEELKTSTITGLIGSYRNVVATAAGVDGDLHLLPSAVHTAECLDASLRAQAQGLPPLVGISHDVQASFRPLVTGGRRLQEATAITKVHSADVVADPAAGGQAVRAVAGGIEDEETDVTVTADVVLAALSTATPEQLAAHGLARAGTTESTARTTEAGPPPYAVKRMIRDKVEDAALPAQIAEALIEHADEHTTEADVDGEIAKLKATLGIAERAGLTPTTATAQVVREAVDKKREALDKFFAGDYSGYHSFKQAYADFTGRTPRMWDEDENRTILRECFGGGFDSGVRSTESLDTTSWAQVLGDSVTRRLVASYRLPGLDSWRRIVSSTPPVNDFRTQRVGRVGGYGTLPVVAEGAAYQTLTSPPDEEATYTLTKKGGLEDLTLEMIANDDVRAISNIPRKLGRAAAQTLYRFVWDMLSSNIVCTYDTVALFDNSHSNTAAAALSQTGLTGRRAAMRGQTAYGDTAEVLGFVPRTLIVPSALEEMAFQLTRSAVAVPATPAGPSDTPNLHQGMDYIVVDHYTDTNDWFVVADPDMCPTIEIGFYLGRQDPELFTQNDNTNGTVFAADVFTWKVRHVYSGTVLDHRGFQRGTA